MLDYNRNFLTIKLDKDFSNFKLIRTNKTNIIGTGELSFKNEINSLSIRREYFNALDKYEKEGKVYLQYIDFDN